MPRQDRDSLAIARPLLHSQIELWLVTRSSKDVHKVDIIQSEHSCASRIAWLSLNPSLLDPLKEGPDASLHRDDDVYILDALKQRLLVKRVTNLVELDLVDENFASRLETAAPTDKFVVVWEIALVADLFDDLVERFLGKDIVLSKDKKDRLTQGEDVLTHKNLIRLWVFVLLLSWNPQVRWVERRDGTVDY